MYAPLATAPAPSPRPPLPRFPTTLALRQAVISAEDEYSAYEDALLAEVNTLRRDPAAYAQVVEAHATVGFPFVRDDAAPEQCSYMTLDQLRVCVQDMQSERAALERALRRTRAEWVDAESSLRERWGQEDAERLRRAKRTAPPRRSVRGSSQQSMSQSQPPGRETESATERQRMAAELRGEFSAKLREAEARLHTADASCYWAADGARRIAALVAELRASPRQCSVAPSRSLVLTARDVGNAHHRVLAVSVPPPRAVSNVHAHATNTPSGNASAVMTGLRMRVSVSSSGDRYMSSLGESETSAEPEAEAEPEPETEEAPAEPLDAVVEGGRLAAATAELHKRYGYCAGEMRGVQLCDALPPRAAVIQMLLNLRAPTFAVPAPFSNDDVGSDALRVTSPSGGNTCEDPAAQCMSPLLWEDARLFGGGWVRAADGVVCVTVLLATTFEQLTLIHARQDFSLPQIHRILHRSDLPTQTGGASVVFVESALGLHVVAPASHPLVVPPAQRVVRIAVHCDSSLAQLSAALTPADAIPPNAPCADRGLLLVQRSLDEAHTTEVLLDVRAARRLWGATTPLFVHLFERDRRGGPGAPFARIGFLRISPSAAALDPLRDTATVSLRDEPDGWPLVTGEFDEREATLLEPLTGAWVSHGAPHRVALRLPRAPHYLLSERAAAMRQMARDERTDSAAAAPLAERVAACRAGLERAEEELAEGGGALEAESAQLRRQFARRRGKELARLRRQDEDARRRLEAMRSGVEAARAALAGAERDLAQRGREDALRAARRRGLAEELRRLEGRADRSAPLRVAVVLVAEKRPLETTRLAPRDEAATLYGADVHVARGFQGRALLLINDQEAVWWDVRPGH